MQRLIAVALAVVVLIFGSTAHAAASNAVAIVTASPASDAAARYLATQIDMPTVRRDTRNARRLGPLTAEARANWSEDLVVVVDAELATVSVLRPSDGTIGSRTLGESATRAPYAVALAAVELLEIVRNAPPAHGATSPPAPPSSLVLRLSTDFGLVQSVGTSGNLSLLEPTLGVDVQFARRGSPVVVLGGIHATGLLRTQHDLTLILPAGDRRGRVDYVRDELSARFGIGHRQGPSAVFGYTDIGVAFIHAHAEDSAGSFSSDDRRAAIWLGLGAELRYTVVGGLALGIGAGVAFLPVASRFYASPPGSSTELTALREDGLDLRARASIIWEFEP
ncbi:MAG TPA: hypothetical protein VH062_23915 [Polyangiaceae bacterium]|nr:hypothetical protein [Polyangiaceae bacterium]